MSYKYPERIMVHKHSVKIGFKFRCRCDYEVTSLNPVWDFENSKWIENHPNNTFGSRIIKSPHCPIHAGWILRS